MDENLIKKAVEAARNIYQKKYAGAELIFLAGSIIRGEATETSDLDLVVIFEKLPNAFRESFYFEGFPVEAFVHDEETLNYFLQREYKNAFSPLMQMILDGIEIPAPGALSQKLKKKAGDLKNRKPPKPGQDEIERFRYIITDMIDDIRHPRSKFELTASGAALYQALSDCYFRLNNLWRAQKKTIPRELEKADAGFQKRFCLAFEDLFANGKSERVIELAEALLLPHGGSLFEGYSSEAPRLEAN